MKKLRKILAFALIIFVVFPTISSAAEPGYSTAGIKIKKRIIKTQQEAATPGVKFEFELSPDSSVAQGATFNGVNLYSGTSDLLTLPVSELQYDGNSGLEKELDLEIKNDLSNYAPGIYRYKLKEIEPFDWQYVFYDGIEYDDTEYIIDVYVTNDDNGSKQVTIISYKSSVNESDIEDGKVSELLFESLYKTYKLTVTKEITGNAADLNETFTLDVTIRDWNNNETFLLRRLINGNPVGDPIYVNNEEAISIDVNSTVGLSFEVYGLSSRDSWAIYEPDSKGYTVSGEESSGEGIPDFAIDKDQEVTITNELNGVIPTGVVDNVGIYVIFTLITAGFAFVYIKSNKKSRV